MKKVLQMQSARRRNRMPRRSRRRSPAAGIVTVWALSAGVLVSAQEAAVQTRSFGEEPGERKPLDLPGLMEDLATPELEPAALRLPDELRYSGEELETVKLARKAFGFSGEEKWEESIPVFKEVIARDPSNKSARFGLGTAYVSLHRYQEASELLESMLKEYPSDYYIMNNLSWLYATAEDPAFRNGTKAVELAQTALLIAPADFHVWSSLAEAYYVSGEYEKGLRAAAEAYGLGLRNKADPRYIEEYKQQISKCKKAALALSILE